MTMIRKMRGLTLIELMVTIAVLAIVVSIGYPMYTKQVQKARRTDARSGIMKLALAQEQYYATYADYAANSNELNLGPDGVVGGDPDTYAYNKAVADVDLTKYNFAIGNDGDANTDDFTITVTAIGSQLDDTDCRTFIIDQTGTKIAKDSGGVVTDKCW